MQELDLVSEINIQLIKMPVVKFNRHFGNNY